MRLQVGAKPAAGNHLKRHDRMQLYRLIRQMLTVAAVSVAGIVQAQNFPVAHWVNDSGADVASVLNSNLETVGVFVTDFKAKNDLTVTRLTSDAIGVFTDAFGGAGAGNNPSYLTNFVGTPGTGTGDGAPGDLGDLDMGSNPSGLLQFDFAIPLTSQDRILIVDVDGTEAYSLEAYFVDGSVTNSISFTNWIAADYTGSTGMDPDSTWPIWTPSTGMLISGSDDNLNEELFVLTPAQSVNRLVVNKLDGLGWRSDIDFIALGGPLSISSAGTNVIVSWTNSTLELQSAPTAAGIYTNIPGATSPYTTSTANSPEFFRLNGN